ncbi:MAG: sugar ABC transporter substrate-binding protein [Anaerolineae bacterium]|nr:sugar ABC transporter substrate-binding protein [Anaerolineae bacterium]
MPEATPTEPPAETPTAEPTPEPVTEISGTIRVGSWESGEALDPWNRAIAGFQAMYPDVTVQLEAVPQGYGDKLLTQFAAGTAPDVFMVGDGDVARFVQRGAVELLDPYINGNNPLDLSLFLPGLLEIGQIDGQTYLLTKDYSPLVVYYNKDLFDEAGLDYPQAGWTWDDFLATAQALTVDEDGDGQIDQWGIQLPNHWGDVTWWRGISPFVFQAGGDILSSDGTTTTGYMNSPETVEAIQFYVDLYREHQVAPGPEDLGALAGVDLFQTGMVGMLWTGRWPLADFKANPNLNFGTVGLPMGKQHANSICWAGFALYSESPNKDTAWAFLKYIAAEEGAEAFADYALTAVAPIAEAQGLTEDPYDGPIIEDLQYLHPLPEFRTMYFSECVEQNFKAAVERLLLQGGDVQAAMDEAAAAADACLARQQ